MRTFALALSIAMACSVARSDAQCPPVVKSVVQPSYAPVVKSVVQPYAPVVEKVVVQREVVFPRFVAVVPLVDYPSYSAVYVPPVAAVQAAPHAQPMQAQPMASGEGKAILDAIGKLSSRLDALERSVQPETRPAPPAPTFAPKGKASKAESPEASASALAVVRNKCASCHSETNSDKGGGFVMLEADGLAKIDSRKANRVIGRSYAGTMPPADSGVPALNDSEVALLVAHYGK